MTERTLLADIRKDEYFTFAGVPNRVYRVVAGAPRPIRFGSFVAVTSDDRTVVYCHPSLPVYRVRSQNEY